MRKVVLCSTLALLLAALPPSLSASAQRGKAPVCGDPTLRCRTSFTFEPHDLPFRLPQNATIWETEPFYAVILKSVKVADEWGECELFVPESERLAAQQLFPRHKVFASRGCAEPGMLYYTNTDPKARFMAVYAGRTRAEANAMLAKVKETGNYPGANLRRMRAGFNGT